MSMIPSRRQFLATAASAAAGLAGIRSSQAAEGPLETTTVRLTRIPSVCLAPLYVAEELLRAEGFTDIRYVDTSSAGLTEAIASGAVDFTQLYASQAVSGIDGGGAITVLAGVHVGCLELFGNDSVHSVADLRGKTVGVPALGSPEHLFVSVMAAHIGLQPQSDIRWITSRSPSPPELFADGKIDAVLASPPTAQSLRARQLGHVVVNSALDRPWAQYFCCMLAGNRDYVRDHPVATKRVARAILKSADLCVTEPARIAQRLVDRGFTPRYDYAVQALNEIPYDKWREYDAEDTLRFFGLRLHEAGFVKSSPQQIIADGTDWRFLNELKRELKA